MERKTQFIILGLAAILVISLFINLQSYSSKQAIEREKGVLKKENTDLSQRIEESFQDNQRLKDKLSSLNRDLEKVSKEREEMQNKYELVTKEREELIQKLKTQPSAAAPEVQRAQVIPVPEDAYWAGILKAKTDLELQLDKIRNELKITQIKNEELQRDKSALDLEIKNLNLETQDLRRQLEYNKKMMDSLAQELVREKNDKLEIQSSLNVIKSENTIIRRQLKSLGSRKINLERRIQQLQEDNSGLERSLTEMETMLKDKATKINDLQEQLDTVRAGGKIEASAQKQESVELPPIVVRPKTETSLQEPPVGFMAKILAVNRDNNFVIIDLGEDSGIRVGDTFGVYREDKTIAEIEVVQIRKTIAACDIKKETTPVKVADTIK